MPPSDLTFGFRHVDGVPTCPCRDPGNYMALEQCGSDPLDGLLRCWCGRTVQVRFDSLDERAAFVAAADTTERTDA